MHCAIANYRFPSCRATPLILGRALQLWPQHQPWSPWSTLKHRELRHPHGVPFRARHCFHQGTLRLLAESSQVCIFLPNCDANRPQEANTVAGQTFFADLRHSAKPPATNRSLTCDTRSKHRQQPCHLRHFVAQYGEKPLSPRHIST